MSRLGEGGWGGMITFIAAAGEKYKALGKATIVAHTTKVIATRMAATHLDLRDISIL